MTTIPRIILNNVSFHLDQTSVQFDKINLSFEKLTYGIVGQNGVGKTSFLSLLLGNLTPDTGSIQVSGGILEAPQSHAVISASSSIADALGITDIINALQRINEGSFDDNDFDLMEGNWDIESRIGIILFSFDLWPIDLNTLFTIGIIIF